MHRFFAETVENGTVKLSAEDARHALRVLRLPSGSAVQMIHDGSLYEATLMVSGESVQARLGNLLPSPEPRARVTLYQGVPKGDKMDFIVQKCTELGAVAVVPVRFSRCVAASEGGRCERWRRIAREAAKQAGRALCPDVHAPISFEELCTRLPAHALSLVPWEEEGGASVRSLYQGQTDVALVIGPEGGIKKDEISRMPAQAVTLGRRILRTETAGMAALAGLLTLSGDMG